MPSRSRLVSASSTGFKSSGPVTCPPLPELSSHPEDEVVGVDFRRPVGPDGVEHRRQGHLVVERAGEEPIHVP